MSGRLRISLGVVAIVVVAVSILAAQGAVVMAAWNAYSGRG